MKDLAEKAHGQYYAALDVSSLPDILLKETVRLIGSYFVEKPMQPVSVKDHPILKGLNPATVPRLLGYNGTTARPNADTHPGFTRRRPDSGCMAVRPGSLCCLDIRREREVGYGLGKVGRIPPVCKPTCRLDFPSGDHSRDGGYFQADERHRARNARRGGACGIARYHGCASQLP